MPRYDFEEIERKWQDRWIKDGVYKFDPSKEGKIYSIDNPPSFTSGSLHMGHALNHSWIDFIARYKRMRGYNVLFPVGFDCHGLPTELKVEKVYGIDKKDRDKFREKCEEWTTEAIAKMKDQYLRLGYSADWDEYYETRMPWYKALVQYSLLEFYRKGLIYRSQAPVLWCPRCETALAKAEVGYIPRKSKLWYIAFPIVEDGKKTEEKITIATTRPELMFSCVGIFVHPEDDRYKHLIGKKAFIPYVDREVPIIADDAVDKEFGTGAVYLCTFGDEMDVKWQMKYDLPVYISIDPKGRLTELAGEFAGMKADEAREKVAEKLKEDGYLVKVEDYEQNVLVHAERHSCMHPIELLPIPQWFIKVKEFTKDVSDAADTMNWYPEHMKERLKAWADSLDWDWIISRQRVYGTPIPFWYCKDCGEIIPPKEEDLLAGRFVDPAKDKPPVDKCPKCGSTNIEGSKDVCDCWVDSSITPLVVAHWKRDDKLFSRVYPVTLRPQGYDIIRTWAFYTIFRDLILTGKPPFKDVVVNGMVAGPDGRKMDKSYGNIIPPEEVLDKYGADALRQWALGAALGEDYPFDWKQIKYASKFQTKLWNASFFIGKHLEGFEPDGLDGVKSIMRPSDKWILSRLDSVIRYSTQALDKYEFGKALNAIREFFWHEVCDNYLEMAKPRLYGDNEDEKKVAREVLYRILVDVTKMLAPFIPHITEEIHELYLKKFTGLASVHLASWPNEIGFSDEKIEEEGKMVMAIASEIRGFKTKNQMSQAGELNKVTIYNADIQHWEKDLKETLKIKEIVFAKGEGSIGIENMNISLDIER